MATCDVCGNEYDKTFRVDGPMGSGTYDCFECAIFANAPSCQTCRCTVIGHGVETSQGLFCSAGCARRRSELDVTQVPDLDPDDSFA